MTVVWLGVKFYKPIKVTVGECSAPRCSTGGPLLLIFWFWEHCSMGFICRGRSGSGNF